MKREAFAAQRRGVLTRGDSAIGPAVDDALANWGETRWWRPITEAALAYFDEVAAIEGATAAEVAGARGEFADSLDERLILTTQPGQDSTAQAERLTQWVSTAATNAATAAAATGGTEVATLEWVTMHDNAVRSTHDKVDGQTIPAGGTFSVAGFDLHYPGEPVGPPDIWINCRCVVRPGPGGDMAAALETGLLADGTMVDDEVDPDAPEVTDDDLDLDVPFYGVAAPEGVPTGDRRKFNIGAIRNRDLPLPFRHQPADIGGHDGAVAVGRIDRIWRDEETNLIKYEGVFHRNEAAETYIDLLANNIERGVSVDLDDTTVEMQNEDGSAFDAEAWAQGDPEPYAVVTDGRIASITGVMIPAFQEAFVAIGTWADHQDARDIEDALAEEDGYAAEVATLAVVEKAWDGSASRFSIEQWRRSCILDTGEGDPESKSRYKLPIREPNGDINKAGVHAAASRFNQVQASSAAKARARSRLVSAYKAIGEEAPELSLACLDCEVAALVSLVPEEHRAFFDDETYGEFGENGVTYTTPDGYVYVFDEEGLHAFTPGVGHTFAPGTHDGPGWITHPRATERIRAYWVHGKGAAKIRWGVPGDFNRCRRQLAKYVKNPKWLAGLCANMHKEAIKIWPGQEGGRKRHALDGDAAPAFTLVASADTVYPHEWFEDPGFTGPTPITVQGERIFGHVAQWGVCHIGMSGVCTQPPSSSTGYAHYLLHSITTDAGEVPVGAITMDTGHAGQRLRGPAATAHYDNTGCLAAKVSCGEDAYGIWVSGVVRPGLTEDQRFALSGATLSGDWREFKRGQLEMVAALAVNVPGFPIPRTSLAASGDEQISLVASGVVRRHEEPEVDVYTVADRVVEILADRAERARAAEILRRDARVAARQALSQ